MINKLNTFFRFGPKVQTVDEREIELRTHMKNLQSLEREFNKKIREFSWHHLRPYWERKWEEIVVLHMEFEWFFHRSNPENFYETYKDEL